MGLETIDRAIDGLREREARLKEELKDVGRKVGELEKLKAAVAGVLSEDTLDLLVTRTEQAEEVGRRPSRVDVKTLVLEFMKAQTRPMTAKEVAAHFPRSARHSISSLLQRSADLFTIGKVRETRGPDSNTYLWKGNAPAEVAAHANGAEV